MTSKCPRARAVAALALVAMAAQLPAPAALGGPISEMLARHRLHRQLQLPPMQKPFSTKEVKDISPSSLSSRFKKRFSLAGPSTSWRGLSSPKSDSGFIRTSR